MYVSGEQASGQPGSQAFTGKPSETIAALAGGIATNCHRLLEDLSDPEADKHAIMGEYGYVLAADLLTASRGLDVPPIMRIFYKAPEKRTWRDAAIVAAAWATDRLDGDLTERARQKTEYGGPADKLVDKWLWHGPAAIQVTKDEMHPIVFSSILLRDIALEKQRNEAALDGDQSAHHAKEWGRRKAALQALTQTLSASPLAARRPKLIEGLQWATALASIGSGILTAAEITSVQHGLDYAKLSPLAIARLGTTSLLKPLGHP